jgi:hypothetical protein
VATTRRTDRYSLGIFPVLPAALPDCQPDRPAWAVDFTIAGNGFHKTAKMFRPDDNAKHINT